MAKRFYSFISISKVYAGVYGVLFMFFALSLFGISGYVMSRRTKIPLTIEDALITKPSSIPKNAIDFSSFVLPTQTKPSETQLKATQLHTRTITTQHTTGTQIITDDVEATQITLRGSLSRVLLSDGTENSVTFSENCEFFMVEKYMYDDIGAISGIIQRKISKEELRPITRGQLIRISYQIKPEDGNSVLISRMLVY